MKRIYVVIKEKFPSELILYIPRHIYEQEKKSFFLVLFHHSDNRDDFGESSHYHACCWKFLTRCT